MNKNEKLLQFIKDHPAISPKKLAEEAGIPWTALYDLQRGRNFPERHWVALLPILKKYGFV